MSPISNVFPALLALRVNTSEARLDGRGIGGLELPVLRDILELSAEEEDALEDGLPDVERLPEIGAERETCSDEDASLKDE